LAVFSAELAEPKPVEFKTTPLNEMISSSAAQPTANQSSEMRDVDWLDSLSVASCIVLFFGGWLVLNFRVAGKNSVCSTNPELLRARLQTADPAPYSDKPQNQAATTP